MSKERGIWYAAGTGGDWTTEVVQQQMGPDSALRGVTIALDGAGATTLVFKNLNDGRLYHAVRLGIADRDQNCDGVDGVDADGDGHASSDSGGDDCDDADADRWQGC